jgi:hypothetical protein
MKPTGARVTVIRAASAAVVALGALLWLASAQATAQTTVPPPQPTVTVSLGNGRTCDAAIVSATVSGTLDFVPTGTVSFTVGPQRPVGTLSGGSTGATITGLPNGTYSASARYNGDSNYAPATGQSGRITIACPVPTTTTTTTTTTVPKATTTTNPTTTTSSSSTTSSSTSTSTTTSTVALAPGETTTTSTTLAPAPVSGGQPTLAALSPAGQPFGPAGVGINVAGSNYPTGCATVYFSFDDTRFGAGSPDRSGHVRVGVLSAPGSAKVGNHQVTSSCRGSGQPVLSTAPFRITPSSVHRSSFVTSVNEPRQISLTLHSALLSAGITALLLIVLGFPSQVFNSTLQEHYEEVRGWFHLRRPLNEIVGDLNQRILFPIFLVAGGVLYALLTPEFGLNLSSLALALGLALAVAVTTIGFAIPTFLYFGMRFRDRGQILVMPGTVLVAAALVLVSRLMHFQPGYLYGLLAVFVFHHELEARDSGRLAAVSSLLVMVLAFVAWVARVPVSGVSMGDHTSFWTILLESALCGAFVIGLESTVVGLLPMRFLDGSRVKEWNRVAWGLLFAFAIFVTVQVLLQPGSGYVGHSSTPAKLAVFGLYLLFGLGTLAFWAYFRYRPPRQEAELATEGDFDVR